MSTQVLENVNNMSPFSVLECLRNEILLYTVLSTLSFSYLSTGEKGYGASPAFETAMQEVLLKIILTNSTIKLTSLELA